MTSMQVGYSQRIQLEWLERTAELYMLGNDTRQIKDLLREVLQDQLSAGATPERGNREKAITILLRTWVSVPVSLEPLRDEGLKHLQRIPTSEHIALHWGMAMAVYPFFGTVAESAGRLLRLQDTVNAAQVQQRLREQFGQRETVARAGRRILRGFVDWGVLIESGTKGTYKRGQAHRVEDPQLAGWLIEAAMRSREAEALSLDTIVHSPALFPFSIARPSPRRSEQNGRLEFFRQGVDQEMVLLRR